jgi:polar amino acid transport system substrate-binding protein
MEAEPDGSRPPGLESRTCSAARHFPSWLAIPTAFLIGLAPPATAEDTLRSVESSGVLKFGADMEGGGPYIYIDPADPNKLAGIEIDLMKRLGAELGVKAEFTQGQWDQLLQLLGTKHVDMVVNGYELTPVRFRDYLATRPYLVLQMQLIARRGGPLSAWEDLARPRPDGRPWLVGVLGGSSAETLLRESYPDTVQVRSYTGVIEALIQTSQGEIDANFQDLPAAQFYTSQYPDLMNAGPPVGHAYCVMYFRRDDQALAQKVDDALARVIASGDLRRIYEEHGVWTPAQEELSRWDELKPTVEAELRVAGNRVERGWALVWRHRGSLLASAAMTIFLSVTAMPLAIVAGLLIALGRIYGPGPLRWLLTAYIELIRGTPLILQLFVLVYVLRLPPISAGILGLAINYSAYEAEIYRAGLQAIPVGQMEAALALGMTRRQALKRVIVPQAVRIVIPPVTNDFIALFKDSSVCSVITLVELSKQYQILAYSTGGVVEFALACALIYLVMSIPLSILSRMSEARFKGPEPASKGAIA